MVVLGGWAFSYERGTPVVQIHSMVELVVGSRGARDDAIQPLPLPLARLVAGIEPSPHPPAALGLWAEERCQGARMVLCHSA